MECARLASEAASEAAKAAALAAKQCRDAVSNALDDAADRAVETARLASEAAQRAANAAAQAAQDARDALDEFDRAEELLRQAQEEEDEQTWLSDFAKPDEEARPKTAAAQSVVDDYEEVAEEEFKPPVHYKKKQQKNFLYEVFSNAPFCSHLDEDAIWVLVNACRMVRCEPSKVLLVEDESADDMYVVEVGACDVTTESEGPIDCKTHAQYYGEEACLKDEPLQASLISSDESITWALDAETLRRTVGPEFDLEEQSSPEPSPEKPPVQKEVHYNEERPDMPPWVGKEESLSPVPVEEEESDEDDWKAPMHYKPRKMSNWLYEIMAAAPFCDGISDELLDQVVTAFAPLKTGPGFGLAFQDNQPERFFVVEQGACVVDDDGDEVGQLKPDQYHGHEALLNYTTERHTVTSSSDLKAWELDKETFLRLLGRRLPTAAQRAQTREASRGAALRANEDLLVREKTSRKTETRAPVRRRSSCKNRKFPSPRRPSSPGLYLVSPRRSG